MLWKDKPTDRPPGSCLSQNHM